MPSHNSLYLHKLGQAPLIEDLLGTATFTGNMLVICCLCSLFEGTSLSLSGDGFVEIHAALL